MKASSNVSAPNYRPTARHPYWENRFCKLGTRRRVLSIAITALAFLAQGLAQDLSGIWKQSNEQCVPKRSGDVTLKIEQHDSKLVSETTSRGLMARHALQHNTTDGVESKSIGADGDEYHSSVVSQDGAPVFSIVEIEDGKRLKSTEIWTLIDAGRTLKRMRQTEKIGDQILIYVRVNSPLH
jgi:hypothetical protein